MAKLYSRLQLAAFSTIAFFVAVNFSWTELNAQVQQESMQTVGVTVPEGFAITQVAGDPLATDIYSMTLTPLDEPVVSGRGYVKILHDRNGDGVYETSTQPFKGPRSGAQGMLFESDKESQQLRFVGDGALWNFAGGELPLSLIHI